MPRSHPCPSVFRPRLRLAAGTLLLAAAAATTVFAGPAPAPPAPSPAPSPAPPPALHLTPPPPALDKRLGELEQAAQRYRGLTLLRPVPWGMLSQADLAREVAEDFREDLPAEKLAPVELSLKTFGLIPESMDLKTDYPKLLSSEIAGFYDTHRKVLALVDGGLFAKAGDRGFDGDMQVKMEDFLLVHELTHAIQDQHFDLDRLDDPDPLADAGVAHLALVEGDASIVALDYLIDRPLEKMPEASQVLDLLFNAVNGPAGGGAGNPGGVVLPGDAELAAAPPYLRETLLFSYLNGTRFCLDVLRHGGQRLLDYAFTSDPPRSSEQILHPEKWFGRRDDPVTITWPDLAVALPGYTKAAEGTLGEEGIRILLRPAPPASAAMPPAGAAAPPSTAAAPPATGATRPATAADVAGGGWGGDRFAVYLSAPGGRRLLAWIADWDSDADAARFQAAAAHLGSDWTVLRTGARRVVVLRGDLPAAPRAAVLATLGTARAELPANRDIDLAHLSASSRPPPAASHP